MKQFLLLCFFAALMSSCSGLEVQAETTKFSMQNNSTVHLQNVVWNNTDFGDIAPGKSSPEQEVPEGDSRICFNISNGSQYCTQELISGKKYRTGKFSFSGSTIVVDLGDSKPSELELVLIPTKLLIRNNSGVNLLNVTWNSFSFEDIPLNSSSELEVIEGSYNISFKLSNGKSYRAKDPTKVEKHKTKEFNFFNTTIVVDPSNSSEKLLSEVL